LLVLTYYEVGDGENALALVEVGVPVGAGIVVVTFATMPVTRAVGALAWLVPRLAAAVRVMAGANGRTGMPLDRLCKAAYAPPRKMTTASVAPAARAVWWRSQGERYRTGMCLCLAATRSWSAAASASSRSAGNREIAHT